MKRRYSDEERAEALAALEANGGDVQRTAADLGLPYMTLRNWSKGHVHPAVAEISNGKKASLADRLEDVARQLVDAMPEKVATANIQQVAMAVGIAIDKMQLLRGQPTAINQNESLSNEERADRILGLLQSRRTRGDRPPDQPAVN